MWLMSYPFFSYIDPMSGSILLQLVIAGLIGLIFKFSRPFRALRAWLPTFRRPLPVAPDESGSDHERSSSVPRSNLS
jgi:hypothetical protein